MPVTNGESSTSKEIRGKNLEINKSNNVNDSVYKEKQTAQSLDISLYSMLNQMQLRNLLEGIAKANRETFISNIPLTLNSDTFLELNFKKDPLLVEKFQSGLLRILTETNFLNYFNTLIEKAVLFAKNVPYFMNINENDRITLLKSCVFEIIIVRHASCYSNIYSEYLAEENSGRILYHFTKNISNF